MVLEAELVPPAASDNLQAPTIGAVRFAAMNYLARREHSAFELKQKLLKRFSAVDLVDSAITELSGQHLQSDQRFAEFFVAARTRRGQGPIRIAAELKQRGVAADIIDAVVDPSNGEWIDVAKAVVDKKFGKEAPGQVNRAKQSRFLYYRGFTSDHIRAAIEGMG